MSTRNEIPFKIKVTRTGEFYYTVTAMNMQDEQLHAPMFKDYTTQAVNIITDLASPLTDSEWAFLIERRLSDHFSGLQYFQSVVVVDERETA